MEKKYLVGSGLVVMLMLTIFIAGCSGTSAPSTPVQSGSTGAVTPASSTGPLYSAGDILKNPKSSAGVGILIVSYDATTDTYKRALIYPNSDGSWGYRMDSSTENVVRATIEKVYTVKVTHVTVSAIPIGTPVTTSTPVPVATTASSTAVTTTATTSETASPTVKGITPNTGYTGTSVSVTGITGYNFLTGATVQLVKSGNPNIAATGVTVVSASDITCTFAIPSNASVGSWGVQVTNQNGYVGSYANGFLVRSNTAAATATTTTTATTTSVTVTAISPSTTQSGTYKSYTITGTHFVSNGVTATLKNSNYGSITASTISQTTSTSMIAFFNIPLSEVGPWDVVVTNADGTTGTMSSGLTVNG
jgi:hypothetical protein